LLRLLPLLPPLSKKFQTERKTERKTERETEKSLRAIAIELALGFSQIIKECQMNKLFGNVLGKIEFSDEIQNVNSLSITSNRQIVKLFKNIFGKQEISNENRMSYTDIFIRGKSSGKRRGSSLKNL
jgi:hypothetical protein